MEIWQTYRNADDIEGRGPMVRDLAFLYQNHAENYIARQPGIMGFLGCGWKVEPVTVMEYDVAAAGKAKADIRAKALLKLTAEEIEALGIG